MIKVYLLLSIANAAAWFGIAWLCGIPLAWSVVIAWMAYLATFFGLCFNAGAKIGSEK